MTPTERLLVMAFGAAVAVVGLVLMFRGRSDSRNVLKAFGAGSELSGSAIIVFLVGVGVFMSPFFVEHREPTPDAQTPADQLIPFTD